MYGIFMFVEAWFLSNLPFWRDSDVWVSLGSKWHPHTTVLSSWGDEGALVGNALTEFIEGCFFGSCRTQWKFSKNNVCYRTL